MLYLIDYIVFLVFDKSLKFVVVKFKFLSISVVLIVSEYCCSTINQHCTFPRLKFVSGKLYDGALHLREYSSSFTVDSSKKDDLIGLCQ